MIIIELEWSKGVPQLSSVEERVEWVIRKVGTAIDLDPYTRDRFVPYKINGTWEVLQMDRENNWCGTVDVIDHYNLVLKLRHRYEDKVAEHAVEAWLTYIFRRCMKLQQP